MSISTGVMAMIFVIIVAVRTFTYAIWSWKTGNKVGFFMVLAVSIASLSLPVYFIFFKV